MHDRKELFRLLRELRWTTLREPDADKLARRACEFLGRRFEGVWLWLFDENGTWKSLASGGPRGAAAEGVVERHLATGDIPPCVRRACQHADMAADDHGVCVDCLLCDGATRPLCAYRAEIGDCHFLLAAVPRKSDSGFLVERAFFEEIAEDVAFALHAARVETARRCSLQEKERLEAQLVQAQKMESIGQLAGGVAHDLNNLLSPILGYADLALREVARRESVPRTWVESRFLPILDAAEKAKSLTGQLLAFGRRQPLEMRLVDVNHEIRELHRILRRLLRADIELDLRLDPRIDAVEADPSQIHQILMNLAVNAQDAMERGGRILIETGSCMLVRETGGLPPGGYVRLLVRDTGVGMSEEVRQRVFEPFFTTKERGKGTGLGLATVYGIVRQHRGSIEVESAIGRGTTFTALLPGAGQGPVAENGRESAFDSDPGFGTILVVEDEEMVRTLVCDILESNGYRTLQACDAESALRLVERDAEPLHLLLADLGLPRMGGRELYGRLAALRPGIKGLFMSGYSQEATASGMPILAKPFSSDLLARRVREALA